MAKYNSLLFRGTLHKNASTKGQLGWISISGLNKYKGHKGYLEITGKEILVDRTGRRAIGAPVPMNSFALPLAKEPDLKILSDPTDKVFVEFSAGLYPGVFSGACRSRQLAGTKKANRLGGRNLRIADFAKRPNRLKVFRPNGMPPPWAGNGLEGYVYVRGSHRKQGDKVKGRNLTALGSQGGDRLALAKSLVAKDNPLVSRVMVNRIWHYMFGRGIVPTTDDFGPMGQMPSNPQLLDWLAADFMENDWSVKRMIREIALSYTIVSRARETQPILQPKSMNLIRTTQVFTGCRSGGLLPKPFAIPCSLIPEDWTARCSVHRSRFTAPLS